MTKCTNQILFPFECIKLDLERWNVLPISWLGRVALLKMSILPRLLYLIQIISILFSHKTINNLNSWFSSFIWAKKRPRLKMAMLRLSPEEGGLDLPDIWRYQLSAHLRFITDWVHKQPTSLWLDIESSMSNFPLKNVLFLKTLKSLKSACSNPTVNTVKAWQTIRRIEGRSNHLYFNSNMRKS